MRYLIVGLNYGCELEPTLQHLKACYPEIEFIVAAELAGLFTCSQAIYAELDNSTGLDQMRINGASFRSGWSAGYQVGLEDHAKYY